MQGVFGVGEFNYVSEICLRPTPVAMVTKFENFDSKFATTELIMEMCILIPGYATSRRLHYEL